MSGLAGLFPTSPTSSPELQRRLDAMSGALRHRGPHAAGTVVEPFAAAACRRLAAGDGSAAPGRGRDPRIQVLLAGDLLNGADLRARLLREHGIDLPPHADAAVLAHLYELHGPDFVHAGHGAFVAVVLDGRDHSVRVHRDRLGLLPLHVAITPGAVVFASEFKALFKSGLVEARVDEDQVLPFLELFHVPGRATLCRGVDKLLPGERLVLQPGRPPVRERWWRAAARVVPQPGERLDELDALLAAVTRDHARAAVPVGIGLCGGVDSSLLAAWAREATPAVRAVTVLQPDTDAEEIACARLVRHTLGLEPVEIAVADDDFWTGLDHRVWLADEPIADPALFPQLSLARAAAAHVGALLLGDGADELFAGHAHTTLAGRAAAYARLAGVLGDRIAAAATRFRRPPAERAAIRAFATDPLPFHAAAASHLSAADRAALQPLARGDHLQELVECFRAAQALDRCNRQLCVDLETVVPHQLAARIDRTCAAVSLAPRLPYLDHRVVELGLSIHGDHKWGNKHENKRVLRRVAARRLPPAIARRARHGFTNPVARWLGADRLEPLRAMLLDRGAFVGAVLPAAWLQSLLASPAALRASALRVHALVVLETWHRVFVRGGGSVPAAG